MCLLDPATKKKEEEAARDKYSPILSEFLCEPLAAFFETTILPVKSRGSGVSHTISVVGEGNSRITVSLL
jgi:hypothetical protein